jgi:hypothetical protein
MKAIIVKKNIKNIQRKKNNREDKNRIFNNDLIRNKKNKLKNSKIIKIIKK